MHENECKNHALFARICCIYAFAMPTETKGKPAVGAGLFVGRQGTVGSQKGVTSFRMHLDFIF